MPLAPMRLKRNSSEIKARSGWRHTLAFKFSWPAGRQRGGKACWHGGCLKKEQDLDDSEAGEQMGLGNQERRRERIYSIWVLMKPCIFIMAN